MRATGLLVVVLLRVTTFPSLCAARTAPTAPDSTAAVSSAPGDPDSAANEPKHAGDEPATLPPPQDYGAPAQVKPKADDARGLTESPGPEPEDYYLFLPRAALWLPNLALKVVFLPLREIATVVDQYHVIEWTKDILYNDARTAAILPTASYQSGYGPSFGVEAFHSDLFGNQEEISAQALYGGLYQQGYRISFEGERVARTPLWLEIDSRYELKPALLFYGYGNASRGGAQPTLIDPRDGAVGTRHRERRFMASTTVGVTNGKPGNLSHAGINALFNNRDFGPEKRRFDEPSIEQVYDTSQIVGFDDGARVLELAPTFIYDSRDTAVLSSEGAYLNLFGGHTLPVSDNADFWHYGATGSVFVDLYQRTRVLALRMVVEAVHGDDSKIPFSELIKLGGPDRLRGYRLDRFRDKIASVATAEYRYPIHELVAGELFLDAGRVGREYSDIFSRDGLKDLRYGGGMGLVFHDKGDPWFKVEAAYGESLVFFFATDPLTAFTRRHKRL